MIPAAALLAITLAAQTPSISAEDLRPEASSGCVASSNTSPVFSPSAWQLVPDSNFPAGVVGPAMAGWDSSSCNPGGTAFPQFTTSPIPGSKPVALHYVDGLNPLNNFSCGQTSSQTGITLYSHAKLPNGTITTCGPISTQIQNLEHELGHKLTLADNYTCPGYIMYQTAFPPQTGPTPPPPLPRAIQDAECAQAAKSNITPAEQAPPPPPPPPPTTCNCPNGCNSSGACLPVNCSTDPSAPQCQQCDENPTAPGCGDGGGGGGGLDPCDPDDPCDDVITRPNTSPPPPAWLRHHTFVIAGTGMAARRCASF